MPKRKERKSKYLRGMRRHGKGNIKNRRGAGNRGGRGKAGMHKHKWSYTVKYEPDKYGRHGFVRHNKKPMPAINVWEIENYIKQNMLEKDGELYTFTFKGKILGSGEITKPVKVRALKITQKAKKKIEEAGGRVEIIKEEIKEKQEKEEQG